MNSTTVTLDYWRNFKPVVPEVIEFEGNENTEIKIPLKSLLIQGARDTEGNSPSEGILDKVQAQRGWRLSPLIMNQPDLGSVRMSDDKESIVYLPKAKFIGDECFNIRLTNGTQASDPIRILVKVKPNYREWFDIYRVSEDRFVFKERHDWPKEKPKPYCYTVFFYWERPVAEWNERRQAHEIFMRSSCVLYSQIGGIYFSFWPNWILRNRLDMEFPTDANLRGFDGTSERAYQPKGTRGHLRMEVRIYNRVATYSGLAYSYQAVDLENWDTLWAETDPDWWLSGNIMPISSEK